MTDDLVYTEDAFARQYELGREAVQVVADWMERSGWTILAVPGAQRLKRTRKADNGDIFAIGPHTGARQIIDVKHRQNILFDISSSSVRWTEEVSAPPLWWMNLCQKQRQWDNKKTKPDYFVIVEKRRLFAATHPCAFYGPKAWRATYLKNPRYTSGGYSTYQAHKFWFDYHEIRKPNPDETFD